MYVETKTFPSGRSCLRAGPCAPRGASGVPRTPVGAQPVTALLIKPALAPLRGAGRAAAARPRSRPSVTSERLFLASSPPDSRSDCVFTEADSTGVRKAVAARSRRASRSRTGSAGARGAGASVRPAEAIAAAIHVVTSFCCLRLETEETPRSGIPLMQGLHVLFSFLPLFLSGQRPFPSSLGRSANTWND